MTTPWPDEAALPPDRPVETVHLPEETEMTRTATVTFDGDTHWLDCDRCEQPIKPVEAGTALIDLTTAADAHRCDPDLVIRTRTLPMSTEES